MKLTLDPKSRRGLIAIKEMNKRTLQGIRSAFFDIGKDLTKDTQASIMDKNKHGHLYRVKVRGISRWHRASAPGEAPANLTGKLRKSTGFEVRGSDQMEFGYRGGKKGVDYGIYLELGTKKGAKAGREWRMAPRPALEMAVMKNQGNMQSKFENLINKSLSK